MRGERVVQQSHRGYVANESEARAVGRRIATGLVESLKSRGLTEFRAPSRQPAGWEVFADCRIEVQSSPSGLCRIVVDTIAS